jgi:tyrosinase
MNTRKNHVNMTAAEKKAFISAVLALKNTANSVLKPGKMKRYDDFVRVHKNAMMGPDMIMPMPHGGPLFFPGIACYSAIRASVTVGG